LVLRLSVGDGHTGAVRLQKKRRGHARLAEPDHEHAFVGEFHALSLWLLPLAFSSSYRSFKVVNANSANTSDAIQKRTMIFDSDQPSSSK